MDRKNVLDSELTIGKDFLTADQTTFINGCIIVVALHLP